MNDLRREIPAMATAVNALLLLWMIAGRGLFVPLGWMLVFGVLVSPVLAICLWISTREMRRPPGRVLTTGQARAQLVLWSAMFVFGFTCVDGGDGPSTGSVLTKFTGNGPTMQTVGALLWWCSIGVGIVAWIVLLRVLGSHSATPTPRS